MGVRNLFDGGRAVVGGWVKVLVYGSLGVVMAAFCVFFLVGSTRRWEAVWDYRMVFFAGWLMTLQISAVALVLSFLVGVVAALGRRSEFLPLRGLSAIYIEVVRGMPFLVLLLFLFYVVADRLQWHDRVAVGVLGLSLFAGAYIAEIVRGGIGVVGDSQLESARAIGLSRWQTYRYVIFPQAFRHALPALAGQFASIIKDSSLLSVLGISEFTYAAQQANSATFSTLECFLPLAVGYLVLTLPVSALSREFERRMHYLT